jgi:hypothetical protein
MLSENHQMIADAIRGSLLNASDTGSATAPNSAALDRWIEQHRLTARCVADALQQIDLRFQFDEFMQACGVRRTSTEQ